MIKCYSLLLRKLKSGQEIGLSRTANIVLHGILYGLSDVLEIWVILTMLISLCPLEGSPFGIYKHTLTSSAFFFDITCSLHSFISSNI